MPQFWHAGGGDLSKPSEEESGLGGGGALNRYISLFPDFFSGGEQKWIKSGTRVYIFQGEFFFHVYLNINFIFFFALAF